MATQTIIDNKYVTLQYHDHLGIVHHVYKPNIGGDYLKEALNTGTELLRKHRATKWLSDNRAIEGHSEKETEWVNTEWLPKTINAGWKYWALVVPQNVMGQMNMNEFVQSFYDMGVRIMVFTDPNEAMDWLIDVDQR